MFVSGNKILLPETINIFIYTLLNFFFLLTTWLVYTFKSYFVILRENLAGIFSKIKSKRFFILVYKFCVNIYFVYFFLEAARVPCSIKNEFKTINKIETLYY